MNNKNYKNAKRYKIYFHLILIICFLFIFLFLLNFIEIYTLNNFGSKDINMNEVRKMQVGGSFYPANKKELDLDLQKLFQNIEVDYNNEMVKAIISPHASYYFSAETAMYGYKKLYYDLLLDSSNKDYKVIILAPAHKEYFKGISISNNKYYQTPYGQVEVVDSNLKKYNQESAHLGEHSIEVQLPLLQFIFNKAEKEFKILPILVGDINYKELASLIEEEIDNRTIIVVSSDLSHFLTEDQAKKRDQLTIENIKKGKEDIDACGKTPIMALNYINKDLNLDCKIKLLNYTTSGEKYTKDNVVGYSSFVYTKENKEHILLRLARRSIYNKLYNKDSKNLNDLKKVFPKEYLNESKGTFVTLNLHDQLRGCIGNIYPVNNIFESIINNSQSAAFKDPRFPPLSKEEFKEIDIEISLLTQPKSCSLEDIKKGEGIILKKGFRQAVYLPQVWDQLPNKEQFLQSLCNKAGLDEQCYKQSSTNFEKFNVKIIK